VIYQDGDDLDNEVECHARQSRVCLLSFDQIRTGFARLYLNYHDGGAVIEEVAEGTNFCWNAKEVRLFTLYRQTHAAISW